MYHVKLKSDPRAFALPLSNIAELRNSSDALAFARDPDSLPGGHHCWHKDTACTRVVAVPCASYVCPLCGQRIDDGKPCGCGARVAP